MCPLFWPCVKHCSNGRQKVYVDLQVCLHVCLAPSRTFPASHCIRCRKRFEVGELRTGAGAGVADMACLS